nr:dynamin family protein [Mitsuokella multacida]
MRKEELQESIHEAQAILEAQGLSSTAPACGLSDLAGAVQSFRAKIVMAGQFSAGKTALLNAFLGGEEILPENISPQTALATELAYGPEAHVIFVHKDGRQEQVSLDDARDFYEPDCLKCIYILPQEILRQIPDLTLVDMPGFDSGIEAHNRALFQYIGEAAAYIFVIDVKNGTLTASSAAFLAELRQYTPIIRFVLTKCDERPSQEVAAVKTEIEQTLSGIFGKEVVVSAVSSRDPGCQKFMEAMLKGFSADALLLEKTGNRFLDLLQQGRQMLLTKAEGLSFQSHDFDVAAQQRQEARERFTRQLARRKRELHRRMHEEYVPQVLSDARDALQGSSAQLASAACSGDPAAFSRMVNDILRPVLVSSVQKNWTLGMEGFADSLQHDIQQEVGEPLAGLSGEKLAGAVEAVKKISQSGMKFAKLHKYKKMYTIFSTGLAVTTNIVAPWLELILIFLPDILSLAQKVFGESPEEAMERQIEERVIPQICARLQPEVERAAAEMEEELVQEAEHEYQAAMEREAEALQQIEQERADRQQDIEQQKQDLQAAAARLQTLQENVTAACAHEYV